MASQKTVAPTSEDTSHTRVNETQSRDDALPRSIPSSTPIETMLSSRPRTFNLVSESSRADGEQVQSHYVLTPFPSAAMTSGGIARQPFPSNTAVHLRPLVTRTPSRESTTQELIPQYEIVQNGLKFKGNVRGIKIIATQVASKTGLETAESHLSVNGDVASDHNVTQGLADTGFVNQNGARFLQSVTDTEAEVSQSAGGKDFHIVTQDAVEVEGDVIGGSFINNQRVW